MQFLSICSIQEVQVALSYVTDNSTLHINSIYHVHITVLWCTHPQSKLFTYYRLTLVFGDWYQISSVSKCSELGVIDPGPIPWLQNQRRNPVFQKALTCQTCYMLSCGLIDHRGSFLWGDPLQITFGFLTLKVRCLIIPSVNIMLSDLL